MSSAGFRVRPRSWVVLAATLVTGCSSRSGATATADRARENGSGDADAAASDAATVGFPPATESRLRICFCGSDYGIAGYAYAELEARHGTCGLGECLATLTEQDVAAYVAARAPDGRVELELTAGASEALRARAPEGRAAELFGEGPFAVSLDGRRLYLGQCYLRMGAAALRYPVMHVEDEDGRVRLRIGDVQGRWAAGVAGGPEETSRMDPPELRALFAGLGKLVER